MRKSLLIIIIAFSASLVSLVALSLYSMGRFSTFTDFSDQVDKTNRTIFDIRSMEIAICDISLSERGFMITRDTAYLRNMNVAIDTTIKSMSAISVLINDNPLQRKNMTLLKAAVALRIAAARANVMHVDTSEATGRTAFYDHSRELMTECTRRLGIMLTIETGLLSERFHGQKFYQHLTGRTLKFLLSVFLFFTLLLFLFMIRELIRRMTYQSELQAKVIDLKRSHTELEEIAFVASHDLQEPLRKIQVFSNMLIVNNSKGSERDPAEVLEKINNAAHRVQSLVTDLMNLTTLARTEEEKVKTDLQAVVERVITEYAPLIAIKMATIEAQMLTSVVGLPSQLAILFSCLMDNSLKFTRDGIPPVINVSCDLTSGEELSYISKTVAQRKFYRITWTDNGIGFDKSYVPKIFRIFQRLHSQESAYEGKGIGLAICQRVIANHEGYIIADGVPGAGATFKLFFPVSS